MADTGCSITILSARIAAAHQLQFKKTNNIQLKAANSSLMKVNGEMTLTATTVIEPVSTKILAIFSEDVQDDCLISCKDLKNLERIPRGFPNVRVPRPFTCLLYTSDAADE